MGHITRRTLGPGQSCSREATHDASGREVRGRKKTFDAMLACIDQSQGWKRATTFCALPRAHRHNHLGIGHCIPSFCSRRSTPRQKQASSSPPHRSIKEHLRGSPSPFLPHSHTHTNTQTTTGNRLLLLLHPPVTHPCKEEEWGTNSTSLPRAPPPPRLAPLPT